MKNKKIVILSPGFPENEADYNCLPYIQDLMLLLADEVGNDRIEVIAFQYPFKRTIYYWNGIRVHAICGKNRNGYFKPITWLRVLKKLRAIKRKNGIQCIHAFWLNETALIGYCFGKFTGCKVITTVIGQDPLKSNKYLRFFRNRKLTLVAISNFVSQRLQENLGRKADQVIPLVWYPEKMRALSSSGLQFDVIGVGNLSELKNYRLFIDVISLLKKERPKITCGIIGKGEQYNILKQKIEQLGLSENIALIGEMDRPEVLSLMKNSSVLLHTSNYESQGFAMSEALYCGMKVVSTPVSDTVAHNSILTGNTPEELAEKALLALENTERKQIVYYDPQNALKYYIKTYGLR